MILKNVEKLPQEVVPVLEKHAGILLDVLGRKLTGIYVHGSATMDSFSPTQSDFDYLAIISSSLTPEERKKLADSLLEIYGRNILAKGIEMSIVVENFAGKDFCYPTPYEFHMGTEEQIRFHGLPHEIEETDPDLAAHFTVIKKRGLCVYGKPIDEIFMEVPKKYYLASIALDSEDSFKNIQEKTGTEKCVVPQYAVLNFCRVLAFIDNDLVTSKTEGGEWALKNVPEKYHPIISAALQEYRNFGSSEKVDSVLLKDFAVYAQNRIQEAVK